jgi:hypothetical protein
MLAAMRALAIVAFAAAAILVGIGRSSGDRFLVAIGAACFFAGVWVFMRWRAKVLDSKFKTPPEDR